jgi:hypothetical protein
MKPFGCLLFLIGLLLSTVFLFAACESITRNRTVQVVARQHTEQVKISEKEQTKRTQIITEGNENLAEIQSDLTKKTDVTFILFYMIRAGLWVVVILLGLLLVLLVSKYKGQYYAKENW